MPAPPATPPPPPAFPESSHKAAPKKSPPAKTPPRQFGKQSKKREPLRQIYFLFWKFFFSLWKFILQEEVQSKILSDKCPAIYRTVSDGIGR